MSQYWSFDHLKNVAINDKNAQENLEDLKSLFRNEIGSARNMYRIQTMEDLIDCLERHDALSETNIEPLREIADQCGGELEEGITSYPYKNTTGYMAGHLTGSVDGNTRQCVEQSFYQVLKENMKNLTETLFFLTTKYAIYISCFTLAYMQEDVIPKEFKSAEPQNKYQEIRMAEELRIQMNISAGQRTVSNGINVNSQQQRHPVYQMPANPSTPAATPNPSQPMLYHELSKENRAAIYKVIAREIGLFWRSFGRELDIPQGIMDEIEMQYPRDLQTRIYKVFQAFEEDETVDSKKHFISICRALDESRRKDLRRKIEKIVSH